MELKKQIIEPAYEENEIEVSSETNQSASEFTLKLKKLNGKPINMNELILTLEEYLTDLTRAVTDREKPGVETH